MTDNKENMLITMRRKVYDILSIMVTKYKIGYNYDIMGDEDKRQASIAKYWKLFWFISRLKYDYNETLRLYDVPTDEFHLNH